MESRKRGLGEGITRLASALAASRPCGLEDAADGVLALLEDQQGQDDVTLLLMRPA